MKLEIPIVVTKNGHMEGDFTFKLASPQLLQALKKIKAPSSDRGPDQIELRQQTLDPNIRRNSARTRRISSSAAAKRFPKDFFKDENCLNPIKSNRSHHKQYQQNFFETFGPKLLPSYQPNFQKEETFDTPKFKKNNENSQVNKNKINNHLSHERLQRGAIRQKYPINSLMQIKSPLVQVNQQLLQRPYVISSIPLISNFILTLGQKGLLPFDKIENRKKERKGEEKENSNYPTGSKTSRQSSRSQRYGVLKGKKKAFG